MIPMADINARDRELVATGEPVRRRIRFEAERRLSDALAQAVAGRVSVAVERVHELASAWAAEVGRLQGMAFASGYRWYRARHDVDAARQDLPGDPPPSWVGAARDLGVRAQHALAEDLANHLRSAAALGGPAIESWRLGAERTLGRAIDASVSDATMVADLAAGRWTIRPELLHPHPQVPDPPPIN